MKLLFKLSATFIVFCVVAMLVALWVLLPPFDAITWFTAIGFTATIIMAAVGTLVLLYKEFTE